MEPRFCGPDNSSRSSRTLPNGKAREDKGMGVKFWHVGDVIRKLREQHDLSATALSSTSGVSRSVIVELESLGPEVEQVSPTQWQALDRLAVAFGLGNGVSLYKLIPEASTPRHRPGPVPAAAPSSRVVPFDRPRTTKRSG